VSQVPSQDRSTNLHGCIVTVFKPNKCDSTVLTKQLSTMETSSKKSRKSPRTQQDRKAEQVKRQKRDQLGEFCIWLTQAKQDKDCWLSEEHGELQDFVCHVESHPVDCPMALTHLPITDSQQPAAGLPAQHLPEFSKGFVDNVLTGRCNDTSDNNTSNVEPILQVASCEMKHEASGVKHEKKIKQVRLVL
jgi:hypothetical protein